jgi:phosphomannomutase
MTDTLETVLSRARAWCSDDPDPATKGELEMLIEAGDEAALQDRMGAMLEFGTAGLRGVIGAGPNRMNRSVVLRATCGLAKWLEEQVPGAKDRGVAIGFDGRRMSREFADDAARVLLAMGFRVFAYDYVVATPVLAFSVLDRKAAAGIMVTASHNPPEYNGYKVYWENGAQIIPPHDTGIAARIVAIQSLAEIPRLDSAPASHARFTKLGDDTIERYLAGVDALVVHRELPRDLRIAYTALHGVGERFFRAAVKRAGFTQVTSVREQAEPDGAFPTVTFPNPEEPGAMDLVVALAKREKSDLAIANDPDADRLAVAVRDPRGEYVMLTGNEIGCLLAHYLLTASPGPNRLVVSTVVSSPMLGAIAAAHGARWERTLTGFKWIANRAIELSRTGEANFVFGYEEALGYCVGTLVRDKDGVSAATLFADMAAWCKSRGKTVLEERDDMWRRYGLFLSEQVSLVLPGQSGLAQIQGMMRAARAKGPSAVAGFAVTNTEDLLERTRQKRGGPVERFEGPTSDVLMFELEGGHRVMARPSGTEPKLKLYHDVRVTFAEGESTEAALARGRALLARIAQDFRSQVEGV